MSRSIAIIGFILMGTVALSGCKTQTNAPPSEEGGASLYPRLTTNGDIAVNNTDAQLHGVIKSAELNPELIQFQVRQVDLLSLRADFNGSYEDFDQMIDIVEQVVEKHSSNADAYLLRARVYSSLHRFDDALSDLDRAESLEGNKSAIERARTGAWIAQGKNLEQALESRRAVAAGAADFQSYIALAAAEMAVGNYNEADAAYEKALEVYSDSSPYAVSFVFFNRGMMWAERAGQPGKSRAFYEEAVRRLPAYCRANVHLAEMEAEAGELERAIQRLETISKKAYDPEPTGFLGELLAESKDKEKRKEAEVLIRRAKERYDILLAKYPEAFADHGTEFFMGPGNDPARALELAELNLANRQTDRARELVKEAKLRMSAQGTPQ